MVIATSESEVALLAQEQRVLITPNTPIPHAPSEQEACADIDPHTVPKNTINTTSSHTDTQSNALQQITPSLLEAVTTPNTAIAARHRPRQNIARPPFPTDRMTRLNGQRKLLASALHMAATLNLDDLGRPLKSGPNTLYWQQAEGGKIQRLLDTATIRAIHAADQPNERSGEHTYYNPQVKEKEASDGTTTYRVRGTIGGDRINYPGPTTARTAAMPLVKLLLQSVISDN